MLNAKAEAARAKPKAAGINARMKITLSLAPPLGICTLGPDWEETMAKGCSRRDRRAKNLRKMGAAGTFI